jgi:ribosome-associated toxin RatA of RatAB toxin-antitoxin module
MRKEFYSRLIPASLHDHSLIRKLLEIASYTCNQLYEIVTDVASYPRFLPFCTSSRILSVRQNPRQENTSTLTIMDAELTVGFLSFKESYISQVTCDPFQSVEVRSYPFIVLRNLFVSRLCRPLRRRCSRH